MRKEVRALSVLALALVLSLSLVVAQEAAHSHQEYYPVNTWHMVLIGLGLLAAFTIISVIFKDNLSEMAKKFLFVFLVISMITVTIYFAGTTIYLNTISSTGGPVHWHTDFEVWHCGEQLDLIDPNFPSNKVGSPSFHEHDDDRIHIEGVVVKRPDVYLSTFFQLIGGRIGDGYARVPTSDGREIEMRDGGECDGEPAELQAFLYRVQNPRDHNDWEVTQTKLEDFTDYVPAPEINVPPGDCLIIEYGPSKERTDNICATYEVAMEKGEMYGG